MAIRETVLEVSINDEKGKTKLFQAIAKLQGVNHVSVDAERGRVSVIGEVDPVLLTKQLRKAGIYAKIMSVGPPRTVDQCDETQQSSCYYCYYNIEISYPPSMPTADSEVVVTGYPVYDAGYDGCNIL